MNLKPKVALSQEFLSNLSQIPAAVQNKILKWAIRFQSDPTASGINYEKLAAARDPNLTSVRIDQDWRGIVLKPPQGDVYVLLHVNHHEKAYRWAEYRKVTINAVTGAMQVVVLETTADTVSAAPSTASVKNAPAAAPLYNSLSDHDLIALGVPEDLIPRVRNILTEEDLDASEPFLPVEAYEGLFLVAAGDTVDQILTTRETRVDQPVDVTDFGKSLEAPESQARFVVVADDETMMAILNAPLAQWRVFLHPTQRRLAVGDRNGSVRVLGGAGTGKTVLALHRAKWLAENRATADQKVLFTTFTRNLTIDCEENLKSLCAMDTLQRIEITNLDAWVYTFLRSHSYEHVIVYDRSQGAASQAWQAALTLRDTTLPLPDGFYEEELERVVLAQGITTLDDYRKAKRAGRGTVLTRSKRDAIWPVFEEYRAQLASRRLKEVDDAYRDAAALLKNVPPRYAAIVVDETQDFGPQALKLLRALMPVGPNDLFFVGDGHQRIYSRHRAVMSACGIDIRGRSRKLYINYRTTEEIRRRAIALLEGCEIDDLDDGSDESRRYKSLSHGPPPETHTCAHLEGALDWIVKRTNALAAEENASASLCVITPTNKTSEVVETTLKGRGIPCKLIRPNERDQPDNTVVRVATMHRAKGLEFDEVILLLPTHWSDGWLNEEDARRLQYVAITRAKKRATLLSVASA